MPVTPGKGYKPRGGWPSLAAIEYACVVLIIVILALYGVLALSMLAGWI